MTSINLNDQVWVKLTPRAIDLLRREHDELRIRMPSLPPYSPPKTDGDGWSSHLLWSLFHDFGSAIHLGAVPPFGTEIRLTDPALDQKEPSPPGAS